MRAHASLALAQRILAALAAGQMHKQMLCAALNCTYQNINPTVARLRRSGEIITLGTAGEAGYDDAQAHAPVYGLPGMTLTKIARRTRKTRGSGSGQIAGRIVIGQRMMQRW